MNTQQIDPASNPYSARVVGYAAGAELQAKLDAGYLCGPWSPRRKAYAVLRRPAKRGRKSRLSADLTREALILLAEMAACRRRIGEIAADAGMVEAALLKRLRYLERKT